MTARDRLPTSPVAYFSDHERRYARKLKYCGSASGVWTSTYPEARAALRRNRHFKRLGPTD